MKIKRPTNKFALLVTLTSAVLMTAVMFTGQLSAQDQNISWQTSPERDSDLEEAFKVGTYSPQAVFEQHPLQQKLMDEYTSMQEAAQKAQQEGDQEKVMQLQQQFEQQRNQIVEQFQREVEKALPKVADEAGVKVIALEIAYIADDVTPQDITAHIVETVTENDKNRAELQF